MKLVLKVKDEKHWADVKDRRDVLQKKIKRETEECVKGAEEEYKRKHGGKDWFEVHGHTKSSFQSRE